MIGTTHFTNAVVSGQGLGRTSVVRLGLPAGAGIPPMSDWPDDLAGPSGGTSTRPTAASSSTDDGSAPSIPTSFAGSRPGVGGSGRGRRDHVDLRADLR